MSQYFGKICAIEKIPSTVDEFHFWIARGNANKVEVGYIVTAENKETGEKVFGLVTNIEFFTDAESILVDYFSHEFGNPNASPPTERQEIHLATAAVIGSSPYIARPMSSGMVRLATPEEIQLAYGMDQIENKIFCGVVTNGPKPENWAPAFMDEKFLLGPEGAHLNISGASGLATKTSAAVFLISSLLSFAKQNKRRYAVLAFNVKGGDLLRLDYGGEDSEYSQTELLSLIRSSASPETRSMISLAEKSGVQLTFDSHNLRMFAPAKANDISKPNSLMQKNVSPFYWSLGDVIRVDAPIRLADLFETEDVDDKAIGVLSKIEELLDDDKYWGGGIVTSFRELVQKMSEKINDTKFWSPHHHSTVSKVVRLVRTNCEGILNGLFAYDEEKGKDVNIESINPGEIWVVDIEAINDRAKRLVFHNLTRRLSDIMEVESLKPRDERRLHGVVVFVDELNKFAPSSLAGNSRIKQQIIDLAARGRSLGIILFGAEQFASRIDKEIIGNASSHLLGRTEIVELEDKAYGWLSKNLRFVVGNLGKGRLLLRHATYGRPVFVKFPQPLYNYSGAAINEMLAAKEPSPSPQLSDAEEQLFDTLKKLLKGHRGLHPIQIYSEISELKTLGINQDTFNNWYHCWLAQQKYRGRSKAEKQALKIILEKFKK